jgi:chromosome segregation ATPase
MARPAEITIKDVETACEHIKSLEQRPAVDRVLAILKKGSRTTINRLLRQYFAQLESIQDTVSTTIPPTVLKKLKEALTISDNDKVAKINELESKLREKGNHIQEILKESEELENELLLHKDQISHFNNRNTEQVSTISRLELSITHHSKDLKFLSEYKEKFIAQKAKNETIADQIKEYKFRIKDLEIENRKLLERAIKAEK